MAFPWKLVEVAKSQRGIETSCRDGLGRHDGQLVEVMKGHIGIETSNSGTCDCSRGTVEEAKGQRGIEKLPGSGSSRGLRRLKY